MNKEKLLTALRKEGLSGVFVKRLERLMGNFATAEAFFAASRGEILKEYANIMPGNTHRLGDSFWKNFDKAISVYRGGDYACNADAKPDAKVYESEGHAEELRLIPLEDLKTVVSFMELCDVEAINIMEIMGFLRNVRIRQNKTVDPAVTSTEAK